MNHLLMFEPWELIVFAFIFLLLFGGKKIPEMMKGLGKGVRSFKEGLNEVENEIKDATKDITKEDKKDSAKKDE
ncbi:MAG: twin-arginine translocase TatA/TatE family subunit [Bacteroidota bacterium]|nr:twin-arginine translocase TatA/TatE family subunit [Bacteroidota bacterium]